METFAGEVFVIGAGAMAEAFVKGVIEKRAISPDRLMVTGRTLGGRAAGLREKYGVRVAGTEAAAGARMVFLAVKPADAAEALAQVRPYLQGQPLVSFAAGVTMDWMAEIIEHRSPVVRTMPNIPVGVQEGATAVSFPEAGLAERDRKDILFLLGQLGEVVEIPERLMNAATAFSGSGPGFVCYFLEAMEAAAIRLGFDPELARALLLQTVVGTARTLREWGLAPDELRRRVTSPGGTTQAGVAVMEAGRLADVVDAALQAAARRSEEMGRAYAVVRD
ncbi:pyrroline-5-carboxylate reductase [Alicyclobacillus macrosporangiidus]|uniref:pyrroline-5-carboxylate reductase n=1 Tax=Alicyclobacillus macrosporangiidus TaxID=392015 RepID=UPI0004967DBC|nr:pyrroline-5-carboxylate reductase [Alicyclobacillus macrosporangiidus]